MTIGYESIFSRVWVYFQEGMALQGIFSGGYDCIGIFS